MIHAPAKRLAVECKGEPSRRLQCGSRSLAHLLILSLRCALVPTTTAADDSADIREESRTTTVILLRSTCVQDRFHDIW